MSGGLPFSLPVKHAQHVVRRSLRVCHFLHLVNREVRCSVSNYPDHWCKSTTEPSSSVKKYLGLLAQLPVQRSWIIDFSLWQQAEVPGQLLVLQVRVCTGCPKHDFPPFIGAGFVQVLIRRWIPPLPHVLEQGPNALHELYPPSTVVKMKIVQGYRFAYMYFWLGESLKRWNSPG